MEQNYNKKLKEDQSQLLSWFEQNARPLPWRKNRNPYFIWISEVMLQQTTVAAVIPFFERFIKSFPTVQSLATAPLEKVYENWAGLGYYSRARNLHKAAKLLNEIKNFPQTADKLIELPGFGPYTSRAVSSIAFEESVGVLDGNVIRVLTRRYGLDVEWWQNKERVKLQALADNLVQEVSSNRMNQALMELGATICTPQNPSCLLCPIRNHCITFKDKKFSQRPIKKAKNPKIILHWKPLIHKKKDKYLFVTNDYVPFLKGLMLFPGKIEILKKAPEKFDLKHNITKYDIYIQLDRAGVYKNKTKSTWLSQAELAQNNPTSLMQKIFKKLESYSGK